MSLCWIIVCHAIMVKNVFMYIYEPDTDKRTVNLDTIDQ